MKVISCYRTHVILIEYNIDFKWFFLQFKDFILGVIRPSYVPSVEILAMRYMDNIVVCGISEWHETRFQ